MKKLLFIISVFCILHSLYSLAYADWFLPQTGQTKCYDSANTEITCTGTGQDGDLRVGMPWPNVRFVANTNGTITDKLTGLVWLKNSDCFGELNWDNALANANNLADGTCGLTDGSTRGQWRLPSIIELESLVDKDQANPYSDLIARGFYNVQYKFYWSNTSYIDSANFASGIDMLYGVMSAVDKVQSYNNYALYVKNDLFEAPGVVQLPKTGQTLCYNRYGTIIACTGTGQDGDLQSGRTLPDNRFIDNSDQTITDNLTKLVWSKNAKPAGWHTSWQGALDYIKSINEQNYLGYSDWRLPNRNELMSLINWGQTAQSNWLSSQGFNTDGHSSYARSLFWSSSSVSGVTIWAWEMGLTTISSTSKNVSYVEKGYNFNYLFAWPVRGGQYWTLEPLIITSNILNFGNSKIESNRVFKAITLHNTGATPQAVTAITLTGAHADQFTIAPGGATPCASLTPTLAAGEKCTLALGFSPSSKGNKSANLSINANTQTLNIPVSGTAYTTISGSVVDQTSKAAVSGATITLSGGATATSDASGALTFGTALPNGTYSATVSKSGYANTVINGIVISDTTGAELKVGLIPPGGMNIAAPASVLYAETGKLFDLRLPVSGGVAPFVLSKAYGTLPPGVTLDASGFGGTPTTAGNYTFAIAVSDSASGYAEQEFTVTVTAPLTFTTNATLPRGVKGSAYSSKVVASGGAAPYTYTLISGTLPTGLTLNANSGVLSGTLSADATGAAIGIKVTDTVGRTTTKNFSLPVDAPLAITTNRLNDAITGVASTQTLAASGGYAPYIWSIFSGQLPAGLSLNSSTGVISGTATNTTSKQIVVSLNDSAGRVLYKQFTINALNPLQITTTAMPNAHVGDAYSELIRTSGGIAPFTYSYNGLLPSGLNLNSTTGIISGTPASAGYVNLSLTVTDSSYPIPQIVTQALGVRTTSQMTITSNSILPTARVNTAINPVTLAVAGGTSPFSWSIISGALPPGINFNTGNGTISGTPTTAGDYLVTLRLADSASSSTGTVSNPDKQFFMHVSAPLAVTTTTVPVGGVNIPYAANLVASGGQLNYSWSIATGTLPTGLSLNPNGTISGIPTTKISGSVTVTVTDSDNPPQTAQKALAFTVNDTLSIIESSLPNARSGQAYTGAVHAMLGTPPYSWRVSAGVKPDGLNLLQNAGIATLQGTASISGTYSFTLEVTDSSTPQQTATRQYTTITYDPFSITKASLNNAERTISYYDTITVCGGVSPYTYSIVTGTLPQGLSLNPATGVVSGTPVAVTSQSSTFTVRVSDSGSPAEFHDQQFSIFVTDPVPIVGACGSNNGKVLAFAPTTGLCSSGTQSASGVWNWSCTGMYGGATASCSATYGFPISVTVTGTGNGTVSSDAVANGVPADISCTTGTCSAGYPNNSSVTLSAVPSVTSTFGGWTGACTGSATPCILTINANKATTATFSAADRARIVGGIGYSMLAEAYLQAAKSTSAIIKTLDAILGESLTMDKAVGISLSGGWNATFTSKSGLPTVLNGVLTIKNGSLIVDGLVIR